MIYYALFHSIMSYGIIAWGGAYTNKTRNLQTLQNRILKIISKNQFLNNKQPLNLEQQFTFDSLQYFYEELSYKFSTSISNTRNKSIQMPKYYKRVSNKSSYLRAIYYFNRLPNNLKTLTKNKVKNKLKEWIKENQ